MKCLHVLLVIVLLGGLSAAERSDNGESPLARRMAAEIVEQAAQDNKAYREVLLDVGKALRDEQMSVSEARDLLSLAVSCRDLGATRRQPDSAAQNFDQVVSGASGSAHQPEMLDIDRLIDEEKLVSATDEKPLFDNLKQGGDKDESGNATNQGYFGGLAGRRPAWDDDRRLPSARNKQEPERASLEAANKQAVTDALLNKAKISGKVGMVKPGLDGLPQIVLINIGAKDGLKDRQELIISRGSQALVKAVVNRVKDFEAFALIMPNTWANGVEKKIKIGDEVREL